MAREIHGPFFPIPKEDEAVWIFIDGSHVRFHWDTSGSRRGEYRAIGMGRGGPTTKIHMASDAHNPLCIEVIGDQVLDRQIAPQLIDQVSGEILKLIKVTTPNQFAKKQIPKIWFPSSSKDRVIKILTRILIFNFIETGTSLKTFLLS